METQNLKQAPVVVIMVPLPAQSHLNSLLQLSCLISTYNIQVHYAGSATHIRQAKQRFNSANNLSTAKLHFHEFPTPPFLSPLPNPNSSIKFPAHLQPSFDASLLLRQPIADLLREISPKARRVVVIHDLLMAYEVQDIATLSNAESYSFHPVSAFNSSALRSQMSNTQHALPLQPEEAAGCDLQLTEGCHTDEIKNFGMLHYEFWKFSSGTIINSCRSIEGTYIDLLAMESILGGNNQIWAIGPLHLAMQQERKNPNSQHKCLEWLDKQAPKSVLYVSFGTTTTMTNEQIKELATGLEQSQHKFIWVLRDADRGDVFSDDSGRPVELPDGYEERVGEVGMVVRDWAPQGEILGHPSTGGFMSHCGWNSCLESISMGVPMAAWPMHSDQPKNAFLVTDILKVGLAVNQWTQREELVPSSTISQVVKSLMASKEGEEARKRTEELGFIVMESVKEGGVSRVELDSFIAHITR